MLQALAALTVSATWDITERMELRALVVKRGRTKARSVRINVPRAQMARIHPEEVKSVRVCAHSALPMQPHSRVLQSLRIAHVILASGAKTEHHAMRAIRRITRNL
jgi:hypothetical protein